MRLPLTLGVVGMVFKLNSMAAGISTNAPVSPPAFGGGVDMGASIVRLFGALALVIALIFGAAWMFKNWQRVKLRGGKSPCLNILEMRHLGQRHALYVVGYKEERFLIAASPASVNLISQLPPEPDSTPAPATPSSFSEALDRAKGTQS